jgi:hypothetical protein
LGMPDESARGKIKLNLKHVTIFPRWRYCSRTGNGGELRQNRNRGGGTTRRRLTLLLLCFHNILPRRPVLRPIWRAAQSKSCGPAVPTLTGRTGRKIKFAAYDDVSTMEWSIRLTRRLPKPIGKRAAMMLNGDWPVKWVCSRFGFDHKIWSLISHI